MKAEKTISASLVLFQNLASDVEGVLRGFQASTLAVRVLVVDNSPTEALRPLCERYGCDYHFAGANLGFGRAHNLAFRKLGANLGAYHLIVNPDVVFGDDVVDKLACVLAENPEVALVVPRATFPDGAAQNLCKRLPSPFVWFARRFLKVPGLLKWINREFEMHDLEQDRPISAPYLSGCFMMVRSQDFLAVGGFDERYFLYCEDADLTRRIFEKHECVYYPALVIQHRFSKGSHRNWRLLWIAICSTFTYFNKWGWIFDAGRRALNRRAHYWVGQK